MLLASLEHITLIFLVVNAYLEEISIVWKVPSNSRAIPLSKVSAVTPSLTAHRRAILHGIVRVSTQTRWISTESAPSQEISAVILRFFPLMGSATLSAFGWETSLVVMLVSIVLSQLAVYPTSKSTIPLQMWSSDKEWSACKRSTIWIAQLLQLFAKSRLTSNAYART